MNSEKTPKKHYVQDMTEILHDAENGPCLSGTFPKNGPARFGSKKSLPSNFAH